MVAAPLGKIQFGRESLIRRSAREGSRFPFRKIYCFVALRLRSAFKYRVWIKLMLPLV